jgi:hypothetical protein
MIEILGEKIFLEEITTVREVWVARGEHKNIHAQEIENYAYSLPAWSSKDKIDAYLQTTLLWQQFKPHPIPLKEFTDRWLSDQMLAIAEVQINPSGKTSRVLALTSEEFQTKVAIH